MIFSVTRQTAPLNDPQCYLTRQRTKLPAVARELLSRANELHGFDIDIDEWLDNPVPRRSLAMPGGFPIVILEITNFPVSGV